MPEPRLRHRPRLPAAGAPLLLLALAACAATELPPAPARMLAAPVTPAVSTVEDDAAVARQAGVAAWQSCRAEGLAMDGLARSSGSPGQYLTAARILDACGAELGAAADAVPREERMRLLALATQAWAKGGDIARARQVLAVLHEAHPDHDLYYPDGTSVKATLTLALEGTPDGGAAANVNPVLKSELQRARYWQAR